MEKCMEIVCLLMLKFTQKCLLASKFICVAMLVVRRSPHLTYPKVKQGMDGKSPSAHLEHVMATHTPS